MASYSSFRRRVRQSIESSMVAINTSHDVISEQHTSEVVDEQMLAQSNLDSDCSDLDSNPQSPDAGSMLWENWRGGYQLQYNSDEYASDSDSSTESECSENNNNSESLIDKVANWAVLHSITLSAVDDLLKIFKPYHKELPATAKALLKTPTSYEIRKLADDEQYYHFGIYNGITNLIDADNGLHQLLITCDVLSLQFNIDGLPLFKSSSCEFWPILCKIKELSSQVFIVGLYCGRKKPSSIDSFLKDFVLEMEQLACSGILLNGACYQIKVASFVCDAPARAYLRNVKSHSGYFGCDKCTVEGEHINNKMVFLETDAPLRLDADFSNAKTDSDNEHHRGKTPLSRLPVGLVTDFVMDYMHLVCLGVVRRLLNYWLKGPPQQRYRLSARTVQALSARLSSMSSYILREFARGPDL